MKIDYQPYTYLIGWSKFDKWYYGSEYSNGRKVANPSNLWNVYFTSSVEVEQFRKDHGEPDVIQVRKVFCTANEVRDWEEKVLQRMKVVSNDKWLNKHDHQSAPILYGQNHPIFGPNGNKVREALLRGSVGRVQPLEERLARSKALKGRIPWNKNKNMPSSFIQKCKNRMSGNNLGKRLKGAKWYNDGKVCSKTLEDLTLKGWKLGRLSWSKQK